MKKAFLILMILSSQSFAAEFEGSISEWRKENETFKKPQESFSKAFQTLKANYADSRLSDEDLYRAATEGMLSALNSGKENWNTLLSPTHMQDTNIEISGQVVGIGVTLDFDEASKNARVRAVIAGSAADKAGLHKNDQILNVNGNRYKELSDMVYQIRGKAGEVVKLKVLREDKILDFRITRSALKIPFFNAANVDANTGYLNISGFTNDSLGDLKGQLAVFKDKKLKKLVIDLRSNRGGVFEKALEVADIFLEKNEIITKAKSRDGSMKDYKATGDAWSPGTKLVVLINEETSSSAEVFAASLKENRKAVLLGSKTAGKWSVESLERLPNDYFIKYSVMTLLSPSGKSFEGVGVVPDFEIGKSASGDFIGYDFINDIKGRIEKDSVLKAAIELPL